MTSAIRLPGFVRSLFTPTFESSNDEKKLAQILEIPIEDLPAVRLGKRYHYRPLSIDKQDGRKRQIMAPSSHLKKLQRRLLHSYLQHLPVHPAATAFVPGSSALANAQRHIGQALFGTMDLMDFFQSTSAYRVRGFFLKQGWRGSALSTLMRLCVYQGGLPQGAPTSPCLSNVVNFELDRAIHRLATRSGALYTRYGDDFTFSWCSDTIPTSFESSVHREVLNAGYQIQPKKSWRLRRIAQEPQITGIVLGRDGRLRAPKHILRRTLRLRLSAWWTKDKKTLAQLNGYRGYIKSIKKIEGRKDRPTLIEEPTYTEDSFLTKESSHLYADEPWDTKDTEDIDDTDDELPF